MSQLERDITIEAPRAAVWSVIADLETVDTWNPGVSSAECGPVTTGVGATRICRLGAGGKIHEVVSEWIEGEELWIAIGDHGGIRSADMGLVLTGGPTQTIVTAVADYHLAFGPLGPVIDRLTVKRLMHRMLGTALAGLKQHIEQDNHHPQSQNRRHDEGSS